MNRRQKIIVSVVGIFIALLALVGITYGYFLTRIQGNTNTTSISVTTADLKLVYGDGNQKVITKTNILPGTLIGEKDFTVSNQGNATEYVVIIDGDNKLDNGINPITVTYASDGTNIKNVPYNEGDITSFESNDFVYTLSCVSSIDGKTCNEKTLESSFPMNGAVIVGNSIEENEVHTYSLKVTYKNTDEDQSLDMNKKFNAIVNIMDIRSINPYKTDNDEVNKVSLTYNIINNSLLKKNGTELKSIPYTKPGIEKPGEYVGTKILSKKFVSIEQVTASASTADDAYNCGDSFICENGATRYNYSNKPTCADVEKKYVFDDLLYNTFYIDGCYGDRPYMLVESETVLSTEEDDYGTSYYYRGMVEDNYVNFAGMCWKIVRIDGNGNIKLILEDQNTECDDVSTTDGNEYIYTGNWMIPASNGETITMSGNSPQLIGDIGYDPTDPKSYITNNYSNSLANSFRFFEKNLKTEISNLYSGKAISDFLVNGDWCLNDLLYDHNLNIINPIDYPYGYFSYDTEARLNKGISLVDGEKKDYNVEFSPTLKCRGTNMFYWDEAETQPMYVGTITADELIYAGAKTTGVYVTDSLNYYLSTSDVFNTLSLEVYDSLTASSFISVEGYLGSFWMEPNPKIRPMITLNKNTVIELGGDGTITNPYVIK